MKLQIKNKTLETIFIYILFLFFSFFITKSFGLTMPDDGWRHLAMALYPEDIQSWNRVYPNTLYTDFDPWFMWHYLLSFISKFVDNSNIPVVINCFVYSLLSFWYYFVFSKFTKVNKYLVFIFAIGLPMLSTRYFYLRPDILSGLFILYFIIINNKIILLLISILYAPFYYIFWFYFAFLGFINLILKEYKKTIILFIAGILGFLFYFIFDFDGYINIVYNVLNNDIFTEGHMVSESQPFIISQGIKNNIGGTYLLIFLTLFSILLFLVFKPKNFLLIYMILLIPLYISQYRFLHLIHPIIYVFIIDLFYKSYKIISNNSFQYLIHIIKDYIFTKTYFYKINTNIIKYLFVLLIISFFVSTFLSHKKEYKNLEKSFLENQFLKNDEFKNKLILVTSMSTPLYMFTYLNPSGSYIPSCSLGWVKYDKKSKKTYFDLLINNRNIIMNDFFLFLNKYSPDYIIIDTSKTSNLKFSNYEIEKNGYIFYKIINTKLIFRKIK